MDTKLLPLIDMAEKGHTEALWELALAYTYGNGVKKDKKLKKKYILKLLEQPQNIHIESYGGLLCILGDISFDLREFDEASDWYMKAIHYFLTHFPPQKAQELMDDKEVEEGLCDAFYWSIEYQNLPK